MNLTIFLLILNVAPCTFGDNSPDAELEKGISALCRESGRAHDEQLLLSLPAEEVVPALVEALRHDPRFRDSFVRYRTYQILSLRRAAERPEGFEQLLRGAREPDGRGDAIIGLARAPVEKRPQVVALFRDLLNDPTLGVPERKALLETTRQLGQTAAELLPGIRRYWNDRTGTLALRAATLECIFEISGPSALGKVLKELQTDSDRVAFVCATVQFAGRRGLKLELDAPITAMVRATAAEVAQKDSGEMRLTALYCLMAAIPPNAPLPNGRLSADERDSIRGVLQAIQSGDPDNKNRLFAEQIMKRLDATELPPSKQQTNGGSGAP